MHGTFRNNAFCLGCGRPLRRRPVECCTACGRPFSICDRASWSRYPWRGRLARHYAGPPNLIDIMLPAAAALATLSAFAAPGRFDRVFHAAAALWVVTAYLWLMRLLGRFGASFGDANAAPPSLAPRPFTLRMAAAPALLALSAGLVEAHLPLKLGFLCSRSGFDRIAHTLPAVPQDQIRAGLYRLHLRPRAGGWNTQPVMHFSAVGDALADDRQFAYLPDLEAASDPRYSPLGGGWHLFRR